MVMHKPESVLENEMHKIHWNFEIQMDHLIPTRRPYLELIKKKKEHASLDFVIPKWKWKKAKR